MYFKFFQLCFGHLFPAVRGQVEDKNSEEGDAHAGDDQVHLVVVVMITKGKVIMITNVTMMITKGKVIIITKEDMVDDDDYQGEGHESY